MATILGNAYVRIRPDMDGFEAETKNATRSALASAAKVAAVAAAGATVYYGGRVLKDSVRAASDLNESMNAVNVTFGKSAKGILDLSKASARTVGLASKDFNALAVQFSNFATTVAGEGGDVTKVIGDLTGRAADFASVMNIDVAEAATLFQSGLAGETEPLRRYGIDLSAAAVEAHAMAMGISDGTGELTEQEKVMARYDLLMQQTIKTQGDFANTSDGLANQQRILAATFEGTKASLGVAFTPLAEAILPQVTKLLQDMTADLEANMPKVQAFMTNLGTSAGDAIAKMGGWEGIKESLEGISGTVSQNWPAIQSTFGNVADAVERVSGVVGVMWDAFQKLPPEVQTLLAMFAIAQKTGVVSIALTAADAVKNLVSNIHANIVNVTGAIGGTGGAAGGAAGAAGKGKGVGLLAPVTFTLMAGAIMYAKSVDLQAERREQGKTNPLNSGTTKVGASTTPADIGGYWEIKRQQMEEEKKYTGILSQKNTVITSSNALTNESREAIARQNAAVAQSTPLTAAAASAMGSMGLSAGNSAKTTGLLTGAIHAAGTASGLTDAQVKAMTSAVLAVPAGASLPQLQSAIGYAGRAAGLTDEQIQGVTASVLAVPREAALPSLRDAIAQAGAAAGLTDAQTKTMTAAVLAIPANASVPQLRDAITKAGAAAGLTDAQIQGVTAAALSVPRDTPANVSTNAPTATTQVQGLQATINSLTGKQVSIRLSFMNDAGYSDSRATYYGTGGGATPANSEPDMESFVMQSIKNAIPGLFPGGGGTGPWRRPAANYNVSSEWMRGGSGIHFGIDLAGPLGSPIFAAAAGSVGQLVRSNIGYGNMVVLNHGGGLSTLYAHLAGFVPGLRVGSTVLPGQVIGQMGSTGDSTGPHLHFETKRGGIAQEPRGFMGARGVLFDTGGWLEPGWTAVQNKTSKPEAILTNEQWRAIYDGKAGNTYNVTMTSVQPASPDEVAQAMRRVDAIYGGV